MFLFFFTFFVSCATRLLCQFQAACSPLFPIGWRTPRSLVALDLRGLPAPTCTRMCNSKRHDPGWDSLTLSANKYDELEKLFLSVTRGDHKRDDSSLTSSGSFFFFLFPSPSFISRHLAEHKHFHFRSLARFSSSFPAR